MESATPIRNYREFVDAIKGLAEHLVTLVHGEQAFVPMVTYLFDGVVSSQPVGQGWFADDTATASLIHDLVVPQIGLVRPESVALTFCGVTEKRAMAEIHEAAMAVVIDRERHEIHEARLVRHDDRASLGAWRPWPANVAQGLLVTPIQEALR